MKKSIKYLLIICLILILSLTGCSKGEKDEELGDLEEKVKTEISYLSVELIDMMNKLNNIYFTTYKVEAKEVSPNTEGGTSKESGENDTENKNNSSDMLESSSSNKAEQSSSKSSVSNNKIKVTEMVKEPTISADYDNVNWIELETSIETLSSSWNTIILDLYKLSINNTDITDFSTQLDNSLLGIKNKDKISALNSVALMYSYIPKYIEAYDKNSASKDISETKMHILNAYVGATNENWNYVISEMSLAEQTFSTILNNNELLKSKEYNINKSYVTLKELQSSIKTQDKTIFFIKYKNLMQELEILI